MAARIVNSEKIPTGTQKPIGENEKKEYMQQATKTIRASDLITILIWSPERSWAYTTPMLPSRPVQTMAPPIAARSHFCCGPMPISQSHHASRAAITVTIIVFTQLIFMSVKVFHKFSINFC